jgi:hypothetical protein
MINTKKAGIIRFSGVLEIFIWLAGAGVLAENVLLLQQNRTLHQAQDPQIISGAHLEMLAGLALDGRIRPLVLPSADSKLLIITFSPSCPACRANQEGVEEAGRHLRTKRSPRTLGQSRHSGNHQRLLLETRHTLLRYAGRPAIQDLRPTWPRTGPEHYVGDS